MSDYDDQQEERRRSQQAWNNLEMERLSRREPALNGLNGVLQSCLQGCLDSVLAAAGVVVVALWLVV